MSDSVKVKFVDVPILVPPPPQAFTPEIIPDTWRPIMNTPRTYEDGFRAALLQIADECEQGVMLCREKFLTAFPNGDFDFMIRATVTADAFQKVADTCRGKATAK